jgi:hypothetical protein
MYSVQDTAEAVGFPIRTSMDQSLFAAPHGFSQRTTSFIASQRQGIHQMPLRRLIALISQCPDNPNDNPTPLHGTKEAPRLIAENGITGIGKTSCKDLPLHPQAWGGRAVRRVPPCPGRRAKHAPRAMARKVKSLLHNVKDLITSRKRPTNPVSSSGRPAPAPMRQRPVGITQSRSAFVSSHSTWWSQTGSNRRPPACKAGALPTELWPRQGTGVRSQVSGKANASATILIPDLWPLNPGTGGPG